MIRRLFEKHLRRPLQNISRQFERVEKDLENMKSWVSYLHIDQKKGKELIRVKEEGSRREIEDIKKWIEYSERRSEHQKELTKSLVEYLKEIHKHQVEIKRQIDELKYEKDKKGQERITQRTTERTQKEAIKQKIPQERLNEELELREEFYEEKEAKEKLTSGQEQLLRVLFQSEIPKGYKELARAVFKKEKSVRNMIYELREKGIKIRDKPIGFRKKGFYLEREEKIRISGR